MPVFRHALYAFYSEVFSGHDPYNGTLRCDGLPNSRREVEFMGWAKTFDRGMLDSTDEDAEAHIHLTHHDSD